MRCICVCVCLCVRTRIVEQSVWNTTWEGLPIVANIRRREPQWRLNSIIDHVNFIASHVTHPTFLPCRPLLTCNTSSPSLPTYQCAACAPRFVTSLCFSRPPSILLSSWPLSSSSTGNFETRILFSSLSRRRRSVF